MTGVRVVTGSKSCYGCDGSKSIDGEEDSLRGVKVVTWSNRV